MISIDLDDIFAGKFYPNQNTNLENFRTRGFLWEDGTVGERNWWVPKNWKNEKKSQANASKPVQWELHCFLM